MSDTADRDRKRAFDAIARELCEAYFTDGFCNGSTEGCKCRRLAEGVLRAMKAVGVEPVWASAPERRANLRADVIKDDTLFRTEGRKAAGFQRSDAPRTGQGRATDGRQAGGPTVAGSG